MLPSLSPLTPSGIQADFGARVTGLNLDEPLPDTIVGQLKEALDRFAFLLLPDQPISGDRQLEITSLWGNVQRSYAAVEGIFARRIAQADLSDVANLDENNQFLPEGDPRRIFSFTNKVWHSDTTYKPVPTKVAFLSARELPPTGGDTQWCDMRAAYDTLDADEQARIADLRVVHSQEFSRSELGLAYSDEDRAKNVPVDHPLVRTHPRTGRKYLYLSSHASHIVSWPVEEGRALVRKLTAIATRPEHVYTHHWSLGDFLIWDNRTTMHRARPWEEFVHRRVLSRSGVDEEARP